MTLIGSEGTGLGSIPTAGDIHDGGGGAKYLSTIYLAGLADDPATDNLFPMASGNMRWWGDTAAGSFPNAAFFENDGVTGGDSRVAAWYTQRYYQTSQGIGGIHQDALVGHDPAWDGTLGALNLLSLTDQQWGFSRGTGQNGFPSGPDYLDIGNAGLQVVSGFFDGPDTFPIPGSNAGARPSWQLRLTNSVDGAPGLRAEVDGWGTSYQYPRPGSNGIMAALDSRGGFGTGYTPAAGDGIGWFIRNSTQDPPKAIAAAVTLDGNVNTGPWGWQWWVYDGGALGKIMSADWTNGIVFNAPVSSPAGGTGVLSSYTTGLLDFTTPANNISMSIPQRPGYMFYRTSAALVIHDFAGTATGSLLGGIGNDVGRSNVAVVNTNASSLNTFGALAPFSIAIASPATTNLDSATQIVAQIATAPTGVTSMHGYLQVNGFWVPS